MAQSSSPASPSVYARDPAHPGRPPRGHRWQTQPDGRKLAEPLSDQEAAQPKPPRTSGGTLRRKGTLLIKANYEALGYDQLVHIERWVREQIQERLQEQKQGLLAEKERIERELRALNG